MIRKRRVGRTMISQPQSVTRNSDASERLNPFGILTIGLALTIPSTAMYAAGESPTPPTAETQISTPRTLRTVEVSDFGDYLPGETKAGTLRAAIENAAPGTRIVFSKAGTVHLLRPLDISNRGVELDGSSSPVVIFGDVVRIKASDVTLRHLWIFAGDVAPNGKAPGKNGHSKGSDRDAIVIWGGDTPQSVIEHITIDHCWIGFGVDECLSTYGNVRGVAVKDSIIGFGLNRSIHPQDKERLDVPGHGKGILIGVGAEAVTLSGNLLLHNFDRNIQVRGGTNEIRFVGNVIYNWGRGNTFYAGDDRGISSGVVAGNMYILGENSSPESIAVKFANTESASRYTVAENIGPVARSTSLANQAIYQIEKSKNPLTAGEAVIDSVEALRRLLASVGPHPALNDKLSVEAIRQIIKREGKVIDYLETRMNPEALNALGYVPTIDQILPDAAGQKPSPVGTRTIPHF